MVVGVWKLANGVLGVIMDHHMDPLLEHRLSGFDQVGLWVHLQALCIQVPQEVIQEGAEDHPGHKLR